MTEEEHQEPIQDATEPTYIERAVSLVKTHAERVRQWANDVCYALDKIEGLTGVKWDFEKMEVKLTIETDDSNVSIVWSCFHPSMLALGTEHYSITVDIAEPINVYNNWATVASNGKTILRW